MGLCRKQKFSFLLLELFEPSRTASIPALLHNNNLLFKEPVTNKRIYFKTNFFNPVLMKPSKLGPFCITRDLFTLKSVRQTKGAGSAKQLVFMACV